MSEEELLKKYNCNNLGVFIDQYLTCQVAYDLLKTQFKEIERLNNVIHKAIEYINENDLYTYIPDNDLGMDYNELVNEKLLDILKG